APSASSAALAFPCADGSARRMPPARRGTRRESAARATQVVTPRSAADAQERGASCLAPMLQSAHSPHRRNVMNAELFEEAEEQKAGVRLKLDAAWLDLDRTLATAAKPA